VQINPDCFKDMGNQTYWPHFWTPPVCTANVCRS